MLSLALVLVHAALLGDIDAAAPLRAPPAVTTMAVMQVRTVDDTAVSPPVSSVLAWPALASPVRVPPAPSPMPPAPASTDAPSRPHHVAAPEPGHARAMPSLPVATTLPASDAAAPDAAPRSEPLAVLAQQTVAPATPSTPAAPASAGDERVPVYRTRTPPAATLRFVMQRGMLRGQAELGWHPAAKDYELRLEGRIAGLSILTQVSQGGFDAAGLAPLRFTDQRLRSAAIAANFQRQAGKVTFSGPQTELPLQPGVQDRLSWMIQLPAIIAAEPALLSPGAKVALHVIGARGDAAVWVLRYVGRDAVEVAGVPVDAEKFSREESGPRDTAVDIWLDPKRHHFPIRATLRNGGDSDALELSLQELTMAQ